MQNRNTAQTIVNDKSLFHIHTFRCGHAEKISDEAYVTCALELGATDLWFSDHTPFPGDPFRSRMRYSQLQEYINTLYALKQQYADQLNIHIGLEIEYFPSFDAMGYYHELKANRKIEFLLLGQHMAELSPSCFSFSMNHEWRDENEYKVLSNAIIDGIQSGYFDFTAHPDRIFRRCKMWNADMEQVAVNIIRAAVEYQIPLEKNESSRRQKHAYWPEFWDLALDNQDIRVVHGLDAHSVAGLKFAN